MNAQAISPEGDGESSWTVDSLQYCPGFGPSEAKVLEQYMPTCVLPQLTPSDHLMLLGLASITHTLFGGSVASSLDAAGAGKQGMSTCVFVYWCTCVLVRLCVVPLVVSP